MGAISSNVANIQQQFMNNITQEDQQNCIATVNNQANNNVIIVNGANIKGDFTGVATTVNTDATCLMVSNMEDSVQNILSAIVQQTNEAETDWFNGFQITDQSNTFNVNQSVTNNINQINQQTCAANTTTSTSNNYVYVGNTNIGGNFVGVTDTANASANCSMTNSMKNSTYNQAQASGTQSNTVKGMFVSIITAFAAIIAIIVIGVIILFATGSIGYVGYKKYSAPTSQTQQENAELAAAAQLGLTPDMLAQLPPPPSVGAGAATTAAAVPISIQQPRAPVNQPRQRPPLPPRSPRSPRSRR